MAMRLLPKQEISVLQASKKRVEIDEGLKLARRIDSLREIAASEEASLASFRASTLKAIQVDIKKIENERNKVLNEVKSLRNELEESTKVLDIREEALIDYETQLNERENEILAHLGLLRIALDELRKQSKRSSELYQKTVSTIALVDEYRSATSNMYDEAKAYLSQVFKIYESAVSLEEKIEKELRDRDIAVASRERDIIIRVEHLDTMAENLRAKELQIIDREKTLEREVTRLKKKYG